MLRRGIGCPRQIRQFQRVVDTTILNCSAREQPNRFSTVKNDYISRGVVSRFMKVIVTAVQHV